MMMMMAIGAIIWVALPIIMMIMRNNPPPRGKRDWIEVTTVPWHFYLVCKPIAAANVARAEKRMEGG